jgi:uncharacterized protein (TIGR02147 family)
MDENSCFAFENYRDFLNARLPTRGVQRGTRARLAQELNCQSAYISRVLAGESDFSLEHAALISRFLGLSELEKEYFLLLVHEARAGNRELTDFYKSRRQEVKEKNSQISARIRVRETLSAEDQMTYYSSWLYAAIHVMITVPGLRSVLEISRHLQLPPGQVQKVLDFLETAGLAKRQGEEYQTGAARIHLSSSSPLISKHHTNWRLKAMQAADRQSPEDLFFSGPISFAKRDVETIRKKLLKLVEEVEPILQGSPEECVYCLDLDFFKL